MSDAKDDDDLSHLNALLGGDEGPREDPPVSGGPRHRVVLLPDAPRLDVDAELDRVMPRFLSDIVDRVNLALDETVPGAGVRFLVEGRQVRVLAEAPDVLDQLPETVVAELSRLLTRVAPAAEFQGDYLGSLRAALDRYGGELTDAYTERERKRILARHVEQRRQGPVYRLKEGDRALVEAATGELPLLGPTDVDGVDTLWSGIHAGAPWLQEASVEAWRAMRHEVGEGRGAWCPPLLLTGPPGTGKTTLGRMLAAALGAPLVEVDAGSGTAAFQLAGVEKGWGSSEPGLLVEHILRARVANPVLIVNELCRAGSGLSSSQGSRTSLSDALLALLDRGSCRRWRCPALRVDFDLSRVTWFLTANRSDTIDPALLSRVRTVQVPKPTPAQVAVLVRRQLGDLDEDLVDHAADVIAEAWAGRVMTLRQVDAMCTRVRRAVTGPRLH
ncbi:MAG: ATP-binding protein [Alphaproteobacteria bacterium]|nr:ATP-binding protein [Alphaproteobacteria bacterium]